MNFNLTIVRLNLNYYTLGIAYQQAKQNNGSPGIDGVTFEMIEASGLDEFLANIRSELQ